MSDNFTPLTYAETRVKRYLHRPFLSADSLSLFNEADSMQMLHGV